MKSTEMAEPDWQVIRSEGTERKLVVREQTFLPLGVRSSGGGTGTGKNRYK
jgi:hypothetical protein